MTLDGDGDTETYSASSIVIATPDGELKSQDVFSLQWTHADGSIINAAHFESDNGDLVTELRLELDASEWLVSGKFKDKDLTAKIDGNTNPDSTVSHTRRLRERLAAKDAVGSKFATTRWTPSADPSRFVTAETSIEKDLGNGLFAARESMEGLEVSYVAEASSGGAVSAEMSVGQIEMKIRRIHTSGSF